MEEQLNLFDEKELHACLPFPGKYCRDCCHWYCCTYNTKLKYCTLTNKKIGMLDNACDNFKQKNSDRINFNY
jgi:hypothetical protein